MCCHVTSTSGRCVMDVAFQEWVNRKYLGTASFVLLSGVRVLHCEARQMRVGPSAKLHRFFEQPAVFLESLINFSWSELCKPKARHLKKMGVYNERLPDDQQVRTYRAVHDNELLHFWSSRDEENKPQRHRPRTRDPTEVRLSNRSACVNKPSLVDATACECCKKSDISSDKATDRHSYENLLLSHERCDRQRTKDDPVVPASPPSVTHEQTSNCCYYDAHLASKCHKLLNQCSGKCASTRVMLFPEEEWAKSAPGIQWSLKMNRSVSIYTKKYEINVLQ